MVCVCSDDVIVLGSWVVLASLRTHCCNIYLFLHFALFRGIVVCRFGSPQTQKHTLEIITRSLLSDLCRFECFSTATLDGVCRFSARPHFGTTSPWNNLNLRPYLTFRSPTSRSSRPYGQKLIHPSHCSIIHSSHLASCLSIWNCYFCLLFLGPLPIPFSSSRLCSHLFLPPPSLLRLSRSCSFSSNSIGCSSGYSLVNSGFHFQISLGRVIRNYLCWI